MSIQIISFNCLLKNKTGHLISSTYNREVLNAIDNESDLLRGLIQGLQNLKKGDKRSINLTAKEAYGFYDPKKVILFPKKKLPKNLKAGDPVSIVGKSGNIHSYKVLQMHDDMVSLDANHPLAGQDLVFEIEALDARDATAAEIEASSNVVTDQLLH